MSTVSRNLDQKLPQKREQSIADLSGSFPYDDNGEPMTISGAYIMTAEMEGFTGLPINEETIEATWKDWRDAPQNSKTWDIYDAPLTLPRIPLNGKKVALSE